MLACKGRAVRHRRFSERAKTERSQQWPLVCTYPSDMRIHRPLAELLRARLIDRPLDQIGGVAKLTRGRERLFEEPDILAATIARQAPRLA